LRGRLPLNPGFSRSISKIFPKSGPFAYPDPSWRRPWGGMDIMKDIWVPLCFIITDCSCQ
jgi:hypothetical protein